MNPSEIRELCLLLPQATFDLKEEWEAELGRIHGKIFLMLGTDNKGIPVLTLKAHPETCIDLKLNYPTWITSGYYMSKSHWISVYIENIAVDWDIVRSLIRTSYDTVVLSLPKRIQKEIEGSANH